MADLFLSYAHEDEARVRPLADAFEARGWTVFWDRRIPEGKSFIEIFTINADGTGLLNLTRTPGAADYRPAWSPRLRKLAAR